MENLARSVRGIDNVTLGGFAAQLKTEQMARQRTPRALVTFIFPLDDVKQSHSGKQKTIAAGEWERTGREPLI